MGSDTSVKKVMAKSGPRGDQEQTYLVSGKRVSLRLWEKEAPRTKEPTKRSYETVGYVISGRAELTLEGQTIKLEPGDSWIVLQTQNMPTEILETFTAIEATSPPAQVRGWDARRDQLGDPPV